MSNQTEYQKSLIEDEITGSNVFKLLVYEKILENMAIKIYIFPIWSMSKPVTTIILYK